MKYQLLSTGVHTPWEASGETSKEVSEPERVSGAGVSAAGVSVGMTSSGVFSSSASVFSAAAP